MSSWPLRSEKELLSIHSEASFSFNWVVFAEFPHSDRIISYFLHFITSYNHDGFKNCYEVGTCAESASKGPDTFQCPPDQTTVEFGATTIHASGIEWWWWW